VTVTFNSGAVLRPFLECVFKQTYHDFILFAVDNASADGTLPMLRECRDERLRVIANPDNRGVAEGNNQGISAAMAGDCEAILLLNNDTEFPDDLFCRLYEALEQFHCDMTTAKILYFEPSNRIWCAGGWLEKSRFFAAFHHGMDETDIGQFEQSRRVTYSPTCCLLVRRSVFEMIGVMDSKYFVYNDDVDFLYRCLLAGLSLWYVPEAKVLHKVSALTGGDSSEFAIRFMTRNRAYFLRKHLPRWKVLLWSLHFIAYTAPLRLLRGQDSFRIYRLRFGSVIEGLRMRYE
jgi:GT2 family glycosyltransferase